MFTYVPASNIVHMVGCTFLVTRTIKLCSVVHFCIICTFVTFMKYIPKIYFQVKQSLFSKFRSLDLGRTIHFFLLNFSHSTLVIREIINLMGKCLQEEKYFAAPLNDYCIRQDVRVT